MLDFIVILLQISRVHMAGIHRSRSTKLFVQLFVLSLGPAVGGITPTYFCIIEEAPDR